MINITLKDYEKKYRTECYQMVAQTWSFHKLLFGVKDKQIVFKGFFETYLAQSHYQKVALNEKGEVLGYLLGKNRKNKEFKTSIKFFFVNMIYFYHILMGAFGKRRRIFELLKLQKKAYGEVIPSDAVFDSEMELFFVDIKARGLGVGRYLMEDFLNNYCRANGLKNIILFTDESSSYEFYEKYGFQKYRTTEYSSKLREVQGKRAFSYILYL